MRIALAAATSRWRLTCAPHVRGQRFQCAWPAGVLAGDAGGRALGGAQGPSIACSRDRRGAPSDLESRRTLHASETCAGQLTHTASRTGRNVRRQVTKHRVAAPQSRSLDARISSSGCVARPASCTRSAFRAAWQR